MVIVVVVVVVVVVVDYAITLKFEEQLKFVLYAS